MKPPHIIKNNLFGRFGYDRIRDGLNFLVFR